MCVCLFCVEMKKVKKKRVGIAQRVKQEMKIQKKKKRLKVIVYSIMYVQLKIWWMQGEYALPLDPASALHHLQYTRFTVQLCGEGANEKCAV